MKRRYKHKLDEIVFTNRWKQSCWGNYTLIGITKYWFSFSEYEWRLCFFGFELRFWMKREFINLNNIS